MQSTPRHYRAKYSYTAVGESQLSFVAGDVLVVPQPDQQRDGWIWAVVHKSGLYDYNNSPSSNNNRNSGSIGWVPLSYLVLEPDQQPQGILRVAPNASSSPFGTAISPRPAAVSATSSSNNPFDSDDNDGGGFTGTAMGGEWTSLKMDRAGHLSPAWSQTIISSSTTSDPQKSPASGRLLNKRIGAGWKNMSRSVQKTSQHAGKTVGSAAQKTAGAIQHAAVETKHRVNDMLQPKHNNKSQQQQEPTDNGTLSNQHHQPGAVQRTRGEQVQVNAANGAARGAVVGGVVGFVLSGGNVAAATHSATVHGVYGGAYGATQGWKPFG